jgi:squalene synthase HpnC
MRAATAAAPTAEEAILERAETENFSVAPFLLGRATRSRLRAIYGFARLVDELGDEAEGDRLALLDRFEEDLGRAFDGTPEHPLLVRLVPTIRSLSLPRAPFLRLIEANRRDQLVARYETYEELLAYCDLSANPVGELVLHVFGAATADRIALSDRVCTALQILEHLQDVAEDFTRGRIYLPAEDLARFGLEPDALAAPQASKELRALLAFETARARGLLEEGGALVGRLRGLARVAVAGYVGGGLATADALAAARFDVLASTPRSGRTRRLARTLGVLG